MPSGSSNNSKAGGGYYSRIIDRKDLAGLTSQEPYSKETYFLAYQKSFKDGEYNIKEPRYTPYGQTIRSYFSGGIAVTAKTIVAAKSPVPAGEQITDVRLYMKETAAFGTPETLKTAIPRRRDNLGRFANEKGKSPEDMVKILNNSEYKDKPFTIEQYRILWQSIYKEELPQSTAYNDLRGAIEKGWVEEAEAENYYRLTQQGIIVAERAVQITRDTQPRAVASFPDEAGHEKMSDEQIKAMVMNLKNKLDRYYSKLRTKIQIKPQSAVEEDVLSILLNPMIRNCTLSKIGYTKDKYGKYIPLPDNKDYNYLSEIRYFTSRNMPIEAMISAYAFKGRNPNRNYPQSFDLSEIAGLCWFGFISQLVKVVYPPGINFTIIADGKKSSGIYFDNPEIGNDYQRTIRKLINALSLEDTVSIMDLDEILPENFTDEYSRWAKYFGKDGNLNDPVVRRIFERAIYAINWDGYSAEHVATIIREGPTNHPAIFSEAENRAIKYLAMQKAVSVLNVYKNHFPAKLRFTFHPKLGQLSINLVSSESMDPPWHGVCGIKLDGTPVIKSRFEYENDPRWTPVYYKNTDTYPMYFEEAKGEAGSTQRPSSAEKQRNLQQERIFEKSGDVDKEIWEDMKVETAQTVPAAPEDNDGVGIDDSTSSPSTSPASGTTGGIDFRNLPIVTQAISNLSAGISLTRLNSINLDSEWQEIEKLVNSGITPSAERVKEYVQASSYKGEVGQDKRKVVLCISDILRSQEEDCSYADSALKDILIVLESGRSNQELKAIFTGSQQ